MKAPKLRLPEIPCKYRTQLRHGHLSLHIVYWLHAAAEAGSWPLMILYGCLCASTFIVEGVFVDHGSDHKGGEQ